MLKNSHISYKTRHLGVCTYYDTGMYYILCQNMNVVYFEKRGRGSSSTQTDSFKINQPYNNYYL